MGVKSSYLFEEEYKTLMYIQTSTQGSATPFKHLNRFDSLASGKVEAVCAEEQTMISENILMMPNLGSSVLMNSSQENPRK